jgi:glucose uptake protein
MILPQTQLQCLIVAILGLVCLGGWATAYKLTGKWRFELFYLDFAVGFGIAALIYAFTFGSLGYDGFDFLDDLSHASGRSVLFAAAAGVVLNLGNTLLLAATSVSGMAVAFPLGLGIALMIGVGTPALQRTGQFGWVGGGMLAVLAAILCLAAGFVSLVRRRREEIPKDAKGRPTVKLPLWRGVFLALGASVLLGLYYPAIARARYPEFGLGPFALVAVIAVAVFGSTIVFSLFTMNLPVQGAPIEIIEYFRGSVKNHSLGVLGGMLWCSGLLAMLIVTDASAPAQLKGSTYAALLWSVPLLAGALGLLAWREFRGASAKVIGLAVLGIVLFGGGIALVVLAPSLAVKP